MESPFENSNFAFKSRLEQNVFIPYLESSRRFAEGYPITAVSLELFVLFHDSEPFSTR
jgi:hypothetical protein